MKLEKRELLHRPRRLRKTETIRQLVRENWLNIHDFIYPLFIIEGENIKNPIASMPGIYQWSIDRVDEEIDALYALGISRILLFGIPSTKDALGSSASHSDGIIQKTIQKLKSTYSDLFIITDVCFCEYTDHGHCGIVYEEDVHNDSTLDTLGRQAVSHAIAGADMIAPSAMMDGMVGEIRYALDNAKFSHTPIMSYAVKYASSFYGPFREAANSSPQFGNRKSYQMDPANAEEALKEVELDIMEGADIIMVKPALSYLDIIAKVKNIASIPVACYNVSGEYSMLKAASKENYLEHDATMMEMLLSMKRAGADIIVSYFAKDVAQLLKDGYGK